jgi:hypothetical protein
MSRQVVFQDGGGVGCGGVAVIVVFGDFPSVRLRGGIEIIRFLCRPLLKTVYEYYPVISMSKRR